MLQHFCYALADGSNLSRQYVGYTVDPPRRLRQHNREIKGGARRTRPTERSGIWEFVFVIGIEHAEFGKHEALSLEWHLQHCYSISSSSSRGGGGNHPRRKRRRRCREPNVIVCLSRVLSTPKFRRFRGCSIVLVAPGRFDEAWERFADCIDSPVLMALDEDTMF
jgi:predicted GIY-YIG superfamily endonuclease